MTPGADPRRSALDRAVLSWMAEPWSDARDDARFGQLARRLFEFQFAHCPAYARFCEARGATPAAVRRWQDIPAVPTGAFKELALQSFPAEREVRTFRTSGTSAERRGALHLDTLALYEASLLPTLRRFLFPDLSPGRRMHVRVLAPSPEELPDSSLSHMFGCALAAQGSADSGYDVVDGALRIDVLLDRLSRACAADEPVALCGTAFAFVHLLEALGGRTFALPPGSRVMETGGFKGRARELPREELHAGIERATGVPASRIVNQYGMTELGSQFYDSVIARPGEPRRKLGPPWARVRIVDPERGGEVPPGEIGMLVIHDLANTGSVAAIGTADLGRTLPGPDGAPLGFEVLGREPDAEERGCSIAADLMLGA